MDGFARGEREAVARHTHDLVLAADQMHLDAALDRVPDRAMLERSQIEVSIQFAIDPAQQVQIERRGDALGVVIGRDQGRLVLRQIQPNKEAGLRA